MPPGNGQRQDDRPLGLPLLERLGGLQNRVEHLVPVGLEAPARAQSTERAFEQADVVGEIDDPRRLRVELRDAELRAPDGLLEELPERRLKRTDAGIIDDDGDLHGP